MNELALTQHRPAPSRRAFRIALAMGAAGVFLLAAMQASYLIAGLIYVAMYTALVWRRPDLGLMVIFALAPFQNDLAVGGPVQFSISELSLGLALMVFVFQHLTGQRPLRLSPVLLPVLLYLAICFLSSMLAYRGESAIVSILQMMIYLIVAVTVFASMVDRRDQLLPAIYGLVGVCTLLAVVLMLSGGQYILGLHKNGVGASLAAGFVVATELWFATPAGRRRSWLTVALVIIGLGLLFSLSRGAWIAAAAGLVVIVALRRQFGLLMRLAILGAPVLLLGWFALDEQEREYAFGFERERVNIQARYDVIDYTWATFWENPVLGTGVGLRKEVDATNIVMFTLAETGIVGLAAFALVHLVVLRMVWKAVRVVPRTDPMYSLLAIGAALMIGRLAHGLVDHYWSRGVLMLAWAAVGMATLAVLTVQRQQRAARQAARGEMR